MRAIHALSGDELSFDTALPLRSLRRYLGWAILSCRFGVRKVARFAQRVGAHSVGLRRKQPHLYRIFYRYGTLRILEREASSGSANWPIFLHLEHGGNLVDVQQYAAHIEASINVSEPTEAGDLYKASFKWLVGGSAERRVPPHLPGQLQDQVR